MQIIEQNSERALLQDVVAYQKENKIHRCLYLHGDSLQEAPDDYVSLIEEAVHTHFPQKYAKLIACSDRDIFFFTEQGSRKLIALFLQDLFQALAPTQLGTKDFEIYESDMNWAKLVLLAKDKFEQLEKQKTEQEKAQHILEEAHKRHSLLNLKINDEHIASIPNRREKRAKALALIVEDDVFTQKLVRNTLPQTVDVVTAKNGFEAMTLYADHGPDILFLDIGLPDISGHDVLAKVLDMDPAAYIVMLSGNGDQDNIMKAVKAGAKGFVGKPFTKDKVFQNLEKSPHIQAKKH